MDGFRMYDIKQGHTISEEKMVMFSFIWHITYSLCVYVHMQTNVHVGII